MGVVRKLAFAGAHRAGKTEAALAYALLASRRGPVLFICDNDEIARIHRRQVEMEASVRQIVFCGVGRFVMISAFSQPFQTIVVDAGLSSVTATQVQLFADRAAAHHGEAWVAFTHSTPT